METMNKERVCRATLYQLLTLAALLTSVCADLLPVNHGKGSGKKPITIWPLKDAEQMHVHSTELAEALPILLPAGLPVMDLGCGVGYYVSELAKRGYVVHAAEGTPGIESISIHKPIHQADLSEPITLNFPQGHVMSFEVAEHLSAEDEDTFVDNVIKFATGRLLLSWALPAACAPGRGHGHLNCRSNLYVVRRLFLQGFSFHAADTQWLRDKVRHTPAFWFKETLLVFDALSPPPLHDILAGRRVPSTRNGSRNEFQPAPSGSGLCEGGLRLREPEPEWVLEVDAQDGADVEMQFDMGQCSVLQETMMSCILVFLDQTFHSTACPRIGETSVFFGFYALPIGKHQMTAVATMPDGTYFPHSAVSRDLEVRAREETVELELEHDPWDEEAAGEGTGDQMRSPDGAKQAAAGPGRAGCGGAGCVRALEKAVEGCQSLMEVVVDMQAELLELRAMLGSQARGQAGVGQAQKEKTKSDEGVGRLERLMGLSAATVDEIVRSVEGGRMGNVLDGSPLAMKQNSRHPLQEVYIRLHRALFRDGLLPIGGANSWGNQRVPLGEQASIGGPLDRNVLPRHSLLEYVDAVKPSLKPNGVCLEWGTDYSTSPLQAYCSVTWDLRHPSDPMCRGRTAFSSEHHLICSSLEALPALAPSSFRPDTIIATQVFEHVESESEAIGAVRKLLAPGGRLVWSAPFLERYHRAPVDMRRYTNDSAVQLIETVGGMCVSHVQVAGDALTTTGYLVGMGTQDFSADEISRGLGAKTSDPSVSSAAEAERKGETLYFGVHVLAQAPPCGEGHDTATVT